MSLFITKAYKDITKTLYQVMSFLLGNQRMIGLGLVIVTMLLIPSTASANVNFNCGGGEIGDLLPNIPCLFGQMVLYLASIFAFLTGNILDLVVNLFVFNMSTTLETGNLFTILSVEEGGSGIPVYREMWFIVRDLANLGFIFILIYAALGTIFRLPNVDAKKVVPSLLLVVES